MATKKLFCCQRPTCKGKRFTSEKLRPNCPQCNLDGNDPKFGSAIQRLAMVHFDPPTEFPGIGQGFRACNPTLGVQAGSGGGGMPNPWNVGSGNVRAISCPDCRETSVFKEALELSESDDAPNQTKAALDRIQETVPLKRI